MTEAVVATSDRFGFRVVGLAPLVAVGMRASARQLWADDLVYAARSTSCAAAPPPER